MNNKQGYNLLTIGVPLGVAILVTVLLVTGFAQPSIIGADGERAKILDDDFCRVSAFNTDENITAEERSEACLEAQGYGDIIMIGAFFVSFVTGFLIMRSIVIPVNEWDNKKNRSALN